MTNAFLLSLKNIARRPLRAVLTVVGLAVSVGLLVCLRAFGDGYQAGLQRELGTMGMQMMLVPLGCPYDAAARVLKGQTLDVTLPQSALETTRRDKSVAVAAPVYAASLPRPELGRTDLWMGVDDSMPKLKPWWKLKPGGRFPQKPNEVLLGAEAAATEMRTVGDKLYSPESKRAFRVCGVLERSGTSDDSQFWVPLATAQQMFGQPGRLTAVAIRLHNPDELGDVTERLQTVKGAQVVTLTEMMGTFLNLAGAARALTTGVALIALVVGALTLFNTMMANALNRTPELGVLRALGWERRDVWMVMASEAVLLSLLGGILGLLVAAFGGRAIEAGVRPLLPLAPPSLPSVTMESALWGVCAALVTGLVAGAYPAWRAGRVSPVAALREVT
jgi:putative ABC transport system permease protein